jgi:N-acyl-D-amino-acid deacylase
MRLPLVSRFVIIAALLLSRLSTAEDPPAPTPEVAIPVSGEERPELAAFDDWMKAFMHEHGIPGGQLAIVRQGRLVYARGFGSADRDAQEPVLPESLFRIASVSKPITAVAVLTLVEKGKLKLDDKVLDHLHYEPHLEDGAQFDERWKQVTIEQCLSHTGGWDREKSYDPMFQAVRMARSLKVDLPILPEHIIRYQLGKPLDFDPGERYAYSNFGYSLLGRIIEKTTGQSYEAYVQQAVLKPLGITRARIGNSLAEERAEGEVRYYDVSGKPGTAVVGPGAGEKEVPVSYGVWRQETLDAHGGWIASAPDLAKFAAAFDISPEDESPRGKLLTRESVDRKFGPQVETTPAKDGKPARFYGLGWMLEPVPRNFIARHGGALPCTAASLMHFPDGTNLAVLFNLGQDKDGKFLGRSIEAPLTRLVQETNQWPENSPR